jgi:hypothetical protein
MWTIIGLTWVGCLILTMAVLATNHSPVTLLIMAIPIFFTLAVMGTE